MKKRIWSPLAGLLGGLLLTCTGLASDDTLTIGSKAPAIEIEHWVQNGEGAFKPVTKFENGKVYVVEFWATWCGPCRMSMPHLAETQKKYAKEVQIISVSDEDLETVEEFLKTKVSSNDEQTYGDLTKGYCLTTDPDKSVTDSYMKAAAQRGIPCAFIVGKDQKIEWIGHPMKMDDPLEQVVKGKWNRDAFAAEFAETQKSEAVMGKVMAALQKQDNDGAMKIVDDFLANAKPSESAGQMAMLKVQLLMQSNAEANKLNEALMGALKMSADSVESLFGLAYMSTEVQRNQDLKNPELFKTILGKLESKSKDLDDNMKKFINYMIGRLQIAAGQKEKGIESLKKALNEVPQELKQEIEEYLKSIQ